MRCHPRARCREFEVRPAWSAMIALIASSILVHASTPAIAREDPERAEDPAGQANLDFHFSEPILTLGIRGGYGFNRSYGEIYGFLTDLLTLELSDFDGPVIAFDGSVRLTAWLDCVLGMEVSVSSTESEYRDFVYQSNAPIEQRTTLTQVPLTFSLKLYPMNRGRKIGRYAWVRSRFVPYVGGGVGATWYELFQEGDFVDFQTLEIFEETFLSNGWSFSSQAFLGLDVKLTRTIGLVVEGRYHWTRADLSGSFIGFDGIRLGGPRVMVGFSWTAR
jgi:opacity protein-like surface antigen